VPAADLSSARFPTYCIPFGEVSLLEMLMSHSTTFPVIENGRRNVSGLKAFR